MTYYIDNPEINKQVIDGIEIISPKAFLEKKIDESENIIVLCEINIDKNDKTINRTEFYGIKFVQELRRKKYKNKVLFVSFCDRVYLSKDPTHSIINTVGHDFLQLPIKSPLYAQSIDHIDVLSETSLLICNNSYCSNHGLINHLTHTLRSNKQVTGLYRNELIVILENIASLYSLSPPLSDFDTKFASLTDSNIEEAINFVENYGEKIKSENPETDSGVEVISKPYTNYEILWLDDEACTDDLLYKTLTNETGLNLKVHLVDSFEKAEILIQNDNLLRPKIMLAIVDYMLLHEKDGVKVQRNKQGFDFIKWVTFKGIPLKILALSSMQRTLQNWLTESYGISIKSIPKKAFNLNSEAGVNYVVEEAIKLANQNWMQINRKPSSAVWEEYLLPSYIQIARDRNYYNIENDISQMALRWVRTFSTGNINPGFIKFGTNNYAHKTTNSFGYSGNSDKFFTNLTNTIRAVESITNPNVTLDSLVNGIYKEIQLIALNIKDDTIDAKALLDNPKKEIASLKKEITDQLKNKLKEIGVEFVISPKEKSTFEIFFKEHIKPAINAIRNQVELIEFNDGRQNVTADELDEDNISFSKNVFAGRRVLLYLSIIKGLKQNEVAYLLGKSEGVTKQIYSSWAALKTEDFPLGITIEEENWFARHFHDELAAKGIDLKKDISDFYAALSQIGRLFGTYFSKTDLKDVITNGIIYSKDNAICINEQHQPIFSTIDEIKILVTYLVTELDIENENKFAAFIELWRGIHFFLQSLKFHLDYDEESSKSIKKRSVRNLGSLFSLERFLLDIAPKYYNNKLSEINKEIYGELPFVRKFTIEDEYILLYKPFDIYFPRKERNKPNFYQNEAELFSLYDKALNLSENSSWINEYKSGLYHFAKYKLKNLNEDDLDDYNLHPFSDISTFKSCSDINERNRLIYKAIIINKREVNKAYSKIYLESRNTKDESGRSAGIITSSIFALDIVNKLKELIENWDDDFPGNDDVLGSLNLEDHDKKKVLTQLKIEPEIQGKNYIVMIQAESFQPVAIYNDTEEIIGYKEYKIKDTNKNISSNDNFIIFAWD